jgi:hypothetical protein
MMLKVILYVYPQMVYFCRGIEKLLQENLLGQQVVPSVLLARAREGPRRVWACGFGPQSTEGGGHPLRCFPAKATEQKKLDGKHDVFPTNFLFGGLIGQPLKMNLSFYFTFYLT